MSIIDWSQILIFIILIVLISPPIGKYMAFVLEGKPTFLTPVFKWLENLCYRFCKIDPAQEMSWREYLHAVLSFNFLGFIFFFLILALQNYLPLNPQNLSGVPWDIAFNSAASFTTNTNWQAYSAETTLSYFSKMAGLTTQNFTSAATGMGALLTLIRGFNRKQTEKFGNFWTDLVRTVVYILLPLSLLLAVFLVSQGVIQTLKPNLEVTTLENEKQVIPLGPAASQIAIKQLGSNGGGFFGVNSAHPLENPTTFSNYFEHLAIVLIPASLALTFGYLIHSFKHGIILFYVIVGFWVVSICASGIAISQSNPALDLSLNLEGIETRLQVSNSSFWTMSTTMTSNGSSNASLSSLAPLTGGIALFNMMVGELVMGGIGTGMCNLLKFVLLTVFLAGLMVGRSPEYLGKKIGKCEISWVVLSILTPCTLILMGTAITCILPPSISSISQKGPHGFSEILYAFTSAASNNGSAFNGLKTNTSYYNIVLGLTMIIGRLSVIIPTIAIGGCVGEKRYYLPMQGSLDTDTLLFGFVLTLIIFILGTLSFFPALLLGPIFEHLSMIRGETF